MNTKQLIIILVSSLLLLTTVPLSAPSVFAGGSDCVIPPSGPWPPCATGGSSGGQSKDCIIPPSGLWPPCATGGNGGGGGQSSDCVIPPSGPWPPCATGGGPTQTPSDSLAINSFNAFIVRQANGPDEIHYSWNTSGATWVELWAGVSHNSPILSQKVGAVGSTVILKDVSDLRLGKAGIVIRTQSEERLMSVDVRFSCEHGYFFNDTDVTIALDGCPSMAVASFPFVYQPFERGFMVYAQAQEIGGELVTPFRPNGPYTAPEGVWPPAFIAVFIKDFNDGQGYYRVDVDFWQEGDMVSDETLVPPQGLLQPTRGFGKVWREVPGLREALGWATVTESADSMTYQYVNNPNPLSANTYFYDLPVGIVARYVSSRTSGSTYWQNVSVSR